MSIWDYADWLEPIPAAARVTLGEGHTPLVRSRVLGPSVGLKNLLFKLDYCNPSGSYKDRFAAAAISHMVADGQERCVATSSGNTGSSLAAYCAAAGCAPIPAARAAAAVIRIQVRWIFIRRSPSLKAVRRMGALANIRTPAQNFF